MNKHTPGPWQVGGQFPTATFINAGSECVAKCDGGDDDKMPHAANARLIAAAPEMLAALTLWVKTGRLANSTNIVESIEKLVAKASFLDKVAR